MRPRPTIPARLPASVVPGGNDCCGAMAVAGIVEKCRLHATFSLESDCSNAHQVVGEFGCPLIQTMHRRAVISDNPLTTRALDAAPVWSDTEPAIDSARVGYGENGVNRLSLNTKLWLALLITWLGLLGLGGWAGWQSRTTMLSERKAAVQNVVECAYGIVADYAKLVDRHELTLDQ